MVMLNLQEARAIWSAQRILQIRDVLEAICTYSADTTSRYLIGSFLEIKAPIIFAADDQCIKLKTMLKSCVALALKLYLIKVFLENVLESFACEYEHI